MESPGHFKPVREFAVEVVRARFVGRVLLAHIVISRGALVAPGSALYQPAYVIGVTLAVLALVEIW